MNTSVNQLAKAIHRMGVRAGWNEGQALRTFVELSLTALMTWKPVSSWRPDRRRFVAECSSTVLRLCSGLPGPRNCFTPEYQEAFGIYWRLVSQGPAYADVLGALHAQFLARNGGEGLGQFFTPPDLVELVVDIGAPFFGSVPRQKSEIFTCADDCGCGAGTLVLAQIRMALRAGPSDRILVRGNDIDPFCAAMTALQLHINQMLHTPLYKASVTVGNTLIYPWDLAYLSLSSTQVLDAVT